MALATAGLLLSMTDKDGIDWFPLIFFITYLIILYVMYFILFIHLDRYCDPEVGGTGEGGGYTQEDEKE